MPKLKLKKKEESVTTVPISQRVKEYLTLRDEKKIIEDRMKVISKEIKDYTMAKGTKDDRGSFYSKDDSYVFGSVCKTSVSLDEEKTLNYLKTRDLLECIEVKEIEKVNEELLEQLVVEGKIPQNEFETLVNKKVSYSVLVKPIEEMEEIQQTTLKKG